MLPASHSASVGLCARSLFLSSFFTFLRALGTTGATALKAARRSGAAPPSRAVEGGQLRFQVSSLLSNPPNRRHVPNTEPSPLGPRGPALLLLPLRRRQLLQEVLQPLRFHARLHRPVCHGRSRRWRGSGPGGPGWWRWPGEEGRKWRLSEGSGEKRGFKTFLK